MWPYGSTSRSKGVVNLRPFHFIVNSMHNNIGPAKNIQPSATLIVKPGLVYPIVFLLLMSYMSDMNKVTKSGHKRIK